MKVSHCNERGCRELVKQGERYCSKHKALHQWTSGNNQQTKDYYRWYNRVTRDQEANDFYHSKQWKTVRDFVVARDMYTDQVTNEVSDELIVDHIIPRRLLSAEQQLDTVNLWSLSRGTHTIKTRMEQHMTDNQLKHCSREWWNKVLKEKIKK
ncbi:HNH endonuclease [Levilactobacillus brevis]